MKDNRAGNATRYKLVGDQNGLPFGTSEMKMRLDKDNRFLRVSVDQNYPINTLKLINP